MIIGGTTYPYLYNAQSWNFDKELVGYNGKNEPIYADTSFFELKTNRLDGAELLWWTTTLLTGLPSKEFSSLTIYDRYNAQTAYTHCIVQKPIWSRFDGFDYFDVTIRIVDIY